MQQLFNVLGATLTQTIVAIDRLPVGSSLTWAIGMVAGRRPVGVPHWSSLLSLAGSPLGVLRGSCA